MTFASVARCHYLVMLIRQLSDPECRAFVRLAIVPGLLRELGQIDHAQALNCVPTSRSGNQQGRIT